MRSEAFRFVTSSLLDYGPDFLHQPPDQCPTMSTAAEAELDSVELRKSIPVSITLEAQNPDLPDPTQFHIWKDEVETTVTSHHGVAASTLPDCRGGRLHLSREITLGSGSAGLFPW